MGVLAAGILAAGGPTEALAQEDTAPGLVAYWNSNVRHAEVLGQVDWSRHDHVSVVETIDWAQSSDAFYPGGPTDYFAVRLLGKIDVPSGGAWSFHLGSDAGARLFIDGRVVINDDANHSFRTTSSIVELSAGVHGCELRYLERNYSQGLILEWSHSSGEGAPVARQVIPASAFLHSVAGEEQTQGDGGLRAYWSSATSHAGLLGQIDWTDYDSTSVVSNVSWPITSEPFYPNGPTDYFSLRLQGLIEIPAAGNWRFNLGSDAGARLFIDGSLVINDDANHSFRFAAGTVDLDEGPHDIVVHYLERNYSQGLVLTWRGPHDPFESVIPPDALTPGVLVPPGDTAGSGINAYWTIHARHAERLGQVDWDAYDGESTPSKIYWPISNAPFEPDQPTDYFALRLLAEINVPRSGNWAFKLGSDAGARLFVEGALVVSDDANHSFRFREGSVFLERGEHPIELQYLERNYSQGLVLTWQGPGDPFESVIPASAFSPQGFTAGPPGSGLRAYWSPATSHATRLGEIDWAKFGEVSIVSDLSWEITNDPFYEDGPRDYFGVRFVGLIDIDQAGRWTFGLGSDAGARMFIDGRLVVNDDANHSFRFGTGQIDLTPGYYPFEVRYIERNYSQGLVATWRSPGGYEQVIPRSAFSLDPVEPVVDAGGGGLRAYWINNLAHATTLGEVDWNQYDSTTVVENVSWYVSSDPFISGGQTDYFGVRLVGEIELPEAGEWTFKLGSDAGARLLVNGELVVNDDANHSFRFTDGSIVLAEGPSTIEIQYLERNYSQGLVLTWQGPSDEFERVVPSSVLHPAEIQVVEDGGHKALTAQWYIDERRSSFLADVDWTSPDATTNVANVSWRITSAPFYTGGPTDYFAARITGRLIVPEAGIWTFKLGSDAGAALFIDGSPVVEDDANHSFRFQSSTLELDAGTHTLEVRYLERNYSQGLVLTWQGPNDPHERVIAPTDFELPQDKFRVIRWREVSSVDGE